MNKTLAILLFLTPLFFGGYSPPKKSEVHFMGFQKIEHDVVKFDNINSEIFNKVDTNLVKIFYNIQSEFGKPINISYGFRDPVTNRKVGGARNSAHIYGLALDLTLDEPSREDIKRLITLATKWNVLGIGVYRDAQILHIDIDEKKGRRAWGSTYSSNSIPSWASKEVNLHLHKNDTLNSKIKEVAVIPQFKSVKTLKVDTISKKQLVTKAPNVKTSKYHIVKKGDTIYSLAKNNNLSVEELCRLNKISKSYRITIGQKLKLN